MILPEITNPDLNETEEEPNSFPPFPPYEMPNLSVCNFFTHFAPFCKSLKIRGDDFHEIGSGHVFFQTLED